MTEQPADPSVTEPTDDAVDPHGEPPASASPPPGISVTGTPVVPTVPATDYTDAGVPTLDYLQEKIDRRYGTALGAAELAGADDEAQARQRAAADRQRAATDRLAEIRRSLHPDDD